MRTLSSFIRRKVETQSGVKLGRCHDLTGTLDGTALKVTGLCVGRKAWLEHFGASSAKTSHVVPWDAVIRIEGKRIIVADDHAG